MNIAKIRRILIIVLTIFVCFLVIFAIYINKSRFYNSETIKYSRVTIDERTDIGKIIDQYSDEENKERFISELKKVNGIPDLSDEKVYGKTIYVPLISN